MQMLLTAGADIEHKLEDGLTPLLTACLDGSLQDVKLLVTHGADLQACAPEGLRCLLAAAKNQHTKVVSYLLEQESCPVDGVDAEGCTVLHYAVFLNDPDVTAKLIIKAVGIDMQNQVQISLLRLSQQSISERRNCVVSCNKEQLSSIFKSVVEIWR